MNQRTTAQPAQPIRGDKGYTLLVGEKSWPLGTNELCSTVSGALVYWRERRESLDQEIEHHQVRVDGLMARPDDVAPTTAGKPDHLERELQYLQAARTNMDATIAMLEAVQAGPGN